MSDPNTLLRLDALRKEICDGLIEMEQRREANQRAMMQSLAELNETLADITRKLRGEE